MPFTGKSQADEDESCMYIAVGFNIDRGRPLEQPIPSPRRSEFRQVMQACPTTDQGNSYLMLQLKIIVLERHPVFFLFWFQDMIVSVKLGHAAQDIIKISDLEERVVVAEQP
jgi:hypothetical protein